MILEFQLPDPLKNAYGPPSDILFPDYICTSLPDRIICSKHGRRKLRKPEQNFMLKLKKVHTTGTV